VEEIMWKPLIAAGAALAIAGSSLVYAQQRFGGAGGFGGPGTERWRPSADDMGAFADARIAALKAGLKLTPDQDKNWPAFEQSLRDLAKLRAERIAAFRQQRSAGDMRDQQQSANPFERLQRRADRMSQFGAALKRMADSGAPLYQSLDDSQKHRFTVLARLLRPHPMMFRGMRHGAWPSHRGDGPNGSFDRGRGRQDGPYGGWRRDRDGGDGDRSPNEL
jgi:zinc resistance-associated protein